MTVPLNELCIRITKGTTPTTLGYPFTEQGINFVKSEAITDDGQIDTSKFAFIDAETHKTLGRSILQEDDVLFSMAGVYLCKTVVVPRYILPANTNQAVGIIRLDQSKALPRFIHYVLSSPACRVLVNRMVAQSAQPNFNLKDIGNIPIPTFPVAEQRAIVHILSRLDAQIELNQQMNKTLEAIGQAIFKHWFVDFEFPNDEGKPYKSSGGELTHDPNLNINIPKIWSKGKFGEITKIQPGYAFQSKDFVENGHRLIKIANIQDAVVETQKGDCISKELFINIDERFHVLSGDIVIAMTGAKLGKVGVVPSRDSTMLLNQRVGKVVSCHKFFAYLFLTRDKNQELFRGYASGSSAQGNVSNSDIEQIEMPIPDNETLNVFTRHTMPLYEKLVLNLGENLILSAIRDLLLPKLMSGKIRVPIDNKVERL